MTFANATCWNPCWKRDRVYTVFEHNAESMDEQIFLAVHSEHDVRLVNPDPGVRRAWHERSRRPIASRDFLRNFLDPVRSHTQAAVVGGSGSGKSHLIRWMDLHIERTDDRVVLILPKLGTSLRKVLEQLIRELPPERRDVYSDRLKQAGYEQLTQDQRRERLLSRIADAVAEDPAGVTGSEEARWLIAGDGSSCRGLPDLFLDPVYRQHVGKPGGTVDRLVRHIGDPTGTYERLEAAREFSLADLPTDPADILSMSKPAQSVLRMLDAELRAFAIEIINRNLDTAIAQVLNFRGDQLVDLMLELRRHLRQQGQELILLIEDFASVQGIDRPLMDALIKESSPQDPLCPMRWIMAVTQDFYERRLPDTVHTRMTYLVDMDLPTTGRSEGLDEDGIISFAARYLNAVRLDPQRLEDWYEDGHEGPAPNVCSTCAHRVNCLPTFGQSGDEIGLYPFNRAAILEMARRQNPLLSERFSPRSLMTNVLAAVLDNYHDDLAHGRFPDRALLEQMNGSQIDPFDQDQLKRSDPVNFDRQLTVLSLWGSPTQLTRLPDALYRAFSITPPIIPDGTGMADDDDGGRGRHQPATLQTRDRVVDTIRRWGGGGPMPPDAANLLRDCVYDSVLAHIDWDQLGLQRSVFASQVRATFARANVHFVRQTTRPPTDGVRLGVPLENSEDDLRQASITLEGLYLYRQARNWNFPLGQQMFLRVAEDLERWSQHVVGQLMALPVPRTAWDPAVAAVEVLAVGAALAGRPITQDSSLVERVNALFEPWPEKPAAGSKEWRALHDLIRRRRALVIKILRAHASGMKGGVARSFLDPNQIVPALLRIRRTWQPARPAPPGLADRSDDWGKLAKVHTEVFAGLAAAAQAEHISRVEWLKAVRQHMAPETGRADVLAAVESAVNLSVDAGLGYDRWARTAYENALPLFQTAQVDQAIRNAGSIEGQPPLRALTRLARTNANAVEAASLYLPAASRVLDQLTGALENRRQQLTSGAAGDAEQLRQKIGDDLARLLTVLEEIGGQRAD